MKDTYTVKIVSNDIELHNKFVSIGLFNNVTVESSFEGANDWPEVDILLVSDRIINVNEFLEHYNLFSRKYKKVFYMLSDNTDNNMSNMRNIMKAKGINVIPPRLTVNQIVERICKDTGTSIQVNKNIFTFFGADSKVGTSITVQAIAENIAMHTRCKILLLNLSGQPSVNYFAANEALNLDAIKVKIMNNILQPKELEDTCWNKDNLYILPSTKSVVDMRYYHPEHIENLILLAAESFDIVLIDAGSNVNLGLCIGALNSTGNKFLITTQQDNARYNFDVLNSQVFSVHEWTPKDFMLIINKYINSPDLYTPSQLAELYQTTFIGTLPYLEYGWQAERDKCTLLTYDNPDYKRQIDEITLLITNQLNIEFIHISNKKIGLLKRLLG